MWLGCVPVVGRALCPLEQAALQARGEGRRFRSQLSVYQANRLPRLLARPYTLVLMAGESVLEGRRRGGGSVSQSEQ